MFENIRLMAARLWLHSGREIDVKHDHWGTITIFTAFGAYHVECNEYIIYSTEDLKEAIEYAREANLWQTAHELNMQESIPTYYRA